MRQPTCAPAQQALRFVVLLFVLSWLMLPWHASVVRAADQIWYVDHAATGANNGSDWANAFTTVQSAINIAQADDEIWVARGVYYTANNAANISSSFFINKPIRIYGGFVGGETELTQRDWDQNKTILSGDIERNDTYSGTYGIVTNPAHIFGTNARNVVRINNAGAGVVLDGFVITGGRITDTADNIANFGAGMIILSTNPMISNIIFSGNTARNGGALYNDSSSPVISGSSFVGNSARNSGGAIYSNYSSHFTLSNSSFTLNSAASGGAISTISSNPLITNSSFYTNTATMGGGALSNAAASPQISNNIFVGNSADAGGAISNVSSTTATITNNTFSNNTAATGGAIRNHGSPNSNISNNTFSSNSATSGGAIANNSTGNLTISANTFTSNNASNGGAIYTEDSKPTITNNSFVTNTASNGGAINNNGSDGIISNNSFSRQNASSGGALYVQNSINPQINNNEFIANTALFGAAFYNLSSILAMNNSAFASNFGTNAGGAIYSSGGNITITNSSFAGNNVSSTSNAAAIHGVSSSRLNLINSIVWGNEASVIVNASSSITITNSLVENCNPAGVWGSACGNNGGNNLVDTDPLFVNPVSYTSAPTITADLRLQGASPAVNAGNNALNTSASDLDGNPRIIDSRIDLGAYETLPRLSTFVVGSGTISYTPTLEAIPVGTTLTVTATASPGWTFVGWSGDLTSTAPQTSILINETKDVTATFSNDLPTADAGSDQSVLAGSLVTLDGSASSDADPTQTLSYAWTQTTGTAVSLSDPSAVSPSFTAPNTADILTFQLVVTDNLGAVSVADTVTITVTNDAPIADAGADQTVKVAETVTLDGSASNDLDGHTPLSYAWTQSAGTAVTLSDPSAVSPSFTAPTTAGSLTFELIVTDSMGLASAADGVTITVTNAAPIADAGADQVVLAGELVTLDGSASNDPDGHTPLSYAWTQSAGSAVTLSDPSAVSPSFTATISGIYTFELLVTDSMGLASAADSVTITVTNGEPVANAGADQVVLAGELVTLDGSASADPDGHTPLSYGWTQIAGTPVSLSDSSAIAPTFTAPNGASVLRFSLVVTDSMGLASAADTVTITVNSAAAPIYQMHLPLIQHSPAELRANLVVTALKADQDGLQLQIKNTGNAATQSAFWVDLYINPSQIPQLNTPWQDIAPAGAVWAVTQTLAPGESLLLTLDSPSFAIEYSLLKYQAGDQLYAIVDSYNANSSYGAISESNEQDNRFGPVSASASAKRVQPTNIPNNYNKLPAR